MYSKKVLDHFTRPRNQGRMENPDGVGMVGNPVCGDMMKIYIKVKDDRIDDIKFETLGCASAIASSSALTEMIKGLTIEEAAKITNEDIARYLGDLPKEKMHCSVMGRDALEKAIAYYRGEPEKKVEGEIVCECFGVTDLEIERRDQQLQLAEAEHLTARQVLTENIHRVHAIAAVHEVLSERGFPGMAHSVAARSGVEAITRSLAVEWASRGVLLNSIAPGYVAIVAGSDKDAAEAHAIGARIEQWGIAQHLRVVSVRDDPERVAEMCDWYNRSLEPGAVIAVLQAIVARRAGEVSGAKTAS